MWTWNIIGTDICVDRDNLKLSDHVILKEDAYKVFLEECKKVYGLEYAKTWELTREEAFFTITAYETHADGPTVYTIEPANLHEIFPGKAFKLDLRVLGGVFEWCVTKDGKYLSVKKLKFPKFS